MILRYGLVARRGAWSAAVLAVLALSLLIRYCTWKATPFIGLKMTHVTLSQLATSYYSQALDIEDTGSFLREYPRLMDAMVFHARTHPPGAVVFMRWIYLAVRHFNSDPDGSAVARALLEFPPSTIAEYWSEGQARHYTPMEVLGAFWVGLVIALLGAAAVVPICLAAAGLFGPRTGLLAGLLGVALPSALLFPVSIDQVLFLLAALSFWLLVLGVRRRQLLLVLAGGLVLGVGIVVSFGMMILAPGLAGLLLWSGRGKEGWRKLALRAGAFLAMVALPTALLSAVYGCNMVVVYQKALEAHHYELTYLVRRTYAKWIVGNLADFFLLGGLPTFVYLLAFWSRKRPRQDRSGLGWKTACVFGGILLVLDFSGMVRGEVGRIWLFLMVFSTILAADSIAEGRRRWPLEGLAVLGLVYLQAITLQTNAVFLFISPF